MSMYDEIKAQLQELIDLVRLDEQYTSAVAHGAVKADQKTAAAHQIRAARIVELKRSYGLT